MRMAWIAVPVIGLAVGVGALAWSDQDGSPAKADTYNSNSQRNTCVDVARRPCRPSLYRFVRAFFGAAPTG